jgi:hypothetical protein
VAVNGCGKLDNPTSLARLAPYLLPTTAAGRSLTSVTGWSVFRRTANPYQISTERDARRHPRDPPISVGQRPIVSPFHPGCDRLVTFCSLCGVPQIGNIAGSRCYLLRYVTGPRLAGATGGGLWLRPKSVASKVSALRTIDR